MTTNKKAAPAEAARKNTTATSDIYGHTLNLPSALRDKNVFVIVAGGELLTFDDACKQGNRIFLSLAAARLSAFHPADVTFLGLDSTPIFWGNDFVLYGERVIGGLEFVELPAEIEWVKCAPISMTLFYSASDPEAKSVRKQYSCDSEGKLLKGEVGAYWNGVAVRHAEAPLYQLYRFLAVDNAPKNLACLCAGVHAEEKQKMGSLAGGKVQNRSKEAFPFPEGAAKPPFSDDLAQWATLHHTGAVV